MEVEIVVVKTPTGHLVRPAYARARPGDTLVWYNYTGLRIQVMLPRTTPGLASFRETGDNGEARLAIPEHVERGFHPYAVFSEEARDFCLGESSPGVIIGR